MRNLEIESHSKSSKMNSGTTSCLEFLKGCGKLPVGILCIITLVHATFVFLTSYPKTLDARLDNLVDFHTNWAYQPMIDL